MQHYGIPTRLLDFSLNPLIALYFAVTDNQDKDGKVILAIVNENRIEYENSAKMQALACLSYTDKISVNIIKEYCENNKDEYADVTQMKFAGSDKSDFKNHVISNYLETLKNNNILLKFKWKNLLVPFMLLANKSFDRMINQDGAFVVFGFYKKLLASNKNFKIKDIIISAENKKTILRQLRLIGIKDSAVYPSLESKLRDMIGKKANWVDYVTT